MLCHSLSGPPLRELLHGNEHDVIHFTPRKQVFEVTLVAVERLHGDLSKKLGTTAELPKELIGKVIPVGHNDERRIFHQLLHERYAKKTVEREFQPLRMSEDANLAAPSDSGERACTTVLLTPKYWW